MKWKLIHLVSLAFCQLPSSSSNGQDNQLGKANQPTIPMRRWRLWERPAENQGQCETLLQCCITFSLQLSFIEILKISQINASSKSCCFDTRQEVSMANVPKCQISPSWFDHYKIHLNIPVHLEINLPHLNVIFLPVDSTMIDIIHRVVQVTGLM